MKMILTIAALFLVGFNSKSFAQESVSNISGNPPLIVTVSPEIATEFIQINGNFTEAFLTISDQNGDVVEACMIGDGTTIDIKRWYPGIYVLTVDDGANSVTQKIVCKTPY